MSWCCWRRHAKSLDARYTRAFLAERKLPQSKLIDVKLSIRGMQRGYVLKMGKISKGRFEARALELIEGHTMLKEIMTAMLRARSNV